MNNQLSCNVDSCCNHNGNCCCLPYINIGDRTSCCSAETCCKSYAPKSGASNSGTCKPNPMLEIGCTACKCHYNNNNQCTSNCVEITHCTKGTHCKTFIE